MIKAMLGAALLLGTQAASAAGVVNPTIDGNRVEAEISIGSYTAELTIEFEDAVGLTINNLGLSAEVINATSSSLLNRLPDPSVMGIAGGFPILLTIEPPQSGGFSFSGVTSIELYTQNLHYDPSVPLRLFSAESGEPFHDITELVASGSYRTRGSKGQFSEFLIVLDTRSTSTVVHEKFDNLNDLMAIHESAMPASLYSSLDSQLLSAENAFNNGNYGAAITDIENFSEAVQNAAANGDIPNVWRSSGDIDNVAGLMRASAATLRFSLTLASNQL